MRGSAPSTCAPAAIPPGAIDFFGGRRRRPWRRRRRRSPSASSRSRASPGRRRAAGCATPTAAAARAAACAAAWSSACFDEHRRLECDCSRYDSTSTRASAYADASSRRRRAEVPRHLRLQPIRRQRASSCAWTPRRSRAFSRCSPTNSPRERIVRSDSGMSLRSSYSSVDARSARRSECAPPRGAAAPPPPTFGRRRRGAATLRRRPARRRRRPRRPRPRRSAARRRRMGPRVGRGGDGGGRSQKPRWWRRRRRRRRLARRAEAGVGCGTREECHRRRRLRPRPQLLVGRQRRARPLIAGVAARRQGLA